jgi:hypothetical protein
VEGPLVKRVMAGRGARFRFGLAASAGVAAALAGCFDVHSVDPGPLVLDDFESHDNRMPADPEFSIWSCGKYNPPTNEGVSCDYDMPGYENSNYSFSLQAEVTDEKDLRMNHAGAALMTHVVGDPVDMTRFETINFAAKVVSGTPPLPMEAQLLVELFCKNAKTEDGTRSDELRVDQVAVYKNNWLMVPLEMRNFTTLTSSTHIKGGTSACLKQVDSVRFAVNAELDDGGSARFTLWIDNITFQ